MVEKLSKLLELPVGEMQPHVLQDILNLTVLTDRRCKGLFDIIQADILSEGDYGKIFVELFHFNVKDLI